MMVGVTVDGCGAPGVDVRVLEEAELELCAQDPCDGGVDDRGRHQPALHRVPVRAMLRKGGLEDHVEARLGGAYRRRPSDQ
jgi:hypothetical protein